MKISIITINYNDARGLERTIKSVVSMTFSNKEFIVIDGASKDDSLDIIHKYSKQISKWVSEPDSGIYSAMNKGIAMASGEYCIFMNSGDAFYSTDVLVHIQKYLKSGKDIYNGNAFFTDSDGRITWYRKGHKDVSKMYFYHSSICHQSSIIKTSLLKKYMYDETLRMVSDWKFWVETICLNHASYEAIDVDICCYDCGGITATHHDLGVYERRKVLLELYAPEEIRLYAELSKQRDAMKYLKDGFTKMFWLVYAKLFKEQHVRRMYGF